MSYDNNPRHAILRLYWACIESFTLLADTVGGSEFSDISTGLKDELGRFRIWVENAGAHRSGRVSLDYRLREAPEVKEVVLELMNNLHSDLQDGM
jgi:hypothetical protein